MRCADCGNVVMSVELHERICYKPKPEPYVPTPTRYVEREPQVVVVRERDDDMDTIVKVGIGALLGGLFF